MVAVKNQEAMGGTAAAAAAVKEVVEVVVGTVGWGVVRVGLVGEEVLVVGMVVMAVKAEMEEAAVEEVVMGDSGEDLAVLEVWVD